MGRFGGEGSEKTEFISCPFESRKRNATSGEDPTTGLKLTLRPIVIQIFIPGLALGFGPYLLQIKSQLSENRGTLADGVHRSGLPLMVAHIVELNVSHHDCKCRIGSTGRGAKADGGEQHRL